MLNTILTGLPGSDPLVIAHGLFGSARNWGVISRRLADSRPVLTVDMRNHGHSPWHDESSYHDMAEDLASVIAAEGGQADVLGHSMGGKATMALALNHAGLVNRVIIADIAPVRYENPNEPLIDAMEGVDLSRVSTRRDADEQLTTTVPEAPLRAFLLQSLDLTGEVPRWRLNLKALRANMSVISNFPEINGRFDGPALFLSGATSTYVQPEHRARILELFPQAMFRQIAGAGHWLHAEKPREFETEIRTFLDRQA